MEKLKIGQWIRKANYTIFKAQKDWRPPTSGHEYWNTPVMEIISIKYPPDDYYVFINGRRFPVAQTKFVVISDEEAEMILEAWEGCKIAETTHKDDITSCVREDNGEPKQKIGNEQSAIEILFQHRMKRPEFHYDAYICGHCGSYHIGKRKEELSKIEI